MHLQTEQVLDIFIQDYWIRRDHWSWQQCHELELRFTWSKSFKTNMRVSGEGSVNYVLHDQRADFYDEKHTQLSIKNPQRKDSLHLTKAHQMKPITIACIFWTLKMVGSVLVAGALRCRFLHHSFLVLEFSR